MILTANEFDEPLLVPIDNIAGLIHARPWIIAKRISKEPLSGQIRPPGITARKTVATHIQLALHADRNRMEGGIEDVAGGIANGPTDRDWFRRIEAVSIKGIGG